MRRSLAMIAFGAVAAQSFGFISFSGIDNVVAAGDPRPNATAAFANYMSVAAANTSVSLINFENVPIGTMNGTVASNASVADTNVNTSSGGVRTFNTMSWGFNTTFGGSRFYQMIAANNSQTMTVTYNFANQINTFGAFFTGIGTSTGVTRLRWTNSQGQQTALINGSNSPSVHFFGIVDLGEAFTSVSVDIITPPTGGIIDDVIGMDDVVYSNCNPVPEPGTMAALGLGALALIRRKRAK